MWIDAGDGIMGDMRRPVPWLVVLAATTLAACGSSAGQSDPSGVDELVIPTPDPDPDDFVVSIDNPWLPLVPGTVWRYQVRSEDGQEVNTVTVTDRTRVVQGVTTTVVHDVVTTATGKLVEDTWDWFAQDAAGNVWYFGEDTTAYDGKRASKEGSWEAGVNGAMAGLVMPAEPRVGDGFRQEFLKGVAEDQASVVSVTQQVTVTTGTYDDVLQTEDTTPLEPGLVEHKFYARGVGLVAERDVTGGSDEVELVSFTQP